jgi:hypothetical protein
MVLSGSKQEEKTTMHIDPKKTLLAGLFLGLAAATSGGYAWDQLVPSLDGYGNVVISLGTDPTKDPEPACVALQIGMNLLMDDLNGDADGGKVTPADRVVLFVTLDGVELVAPGSDEPKSKISKQTCLTPGGLKPLSGILNQFVSLGGEVVICPLCWSGRDYAAGDQTYGIVANAFDIHSLFLYADKVITF